MLELEGVDTFYGQSHVLQGVALGVGDGETVALLGRNGAGKTTTLRSILGLTPPRRGRIALAGQEIIGRPPYAVARLGVALVPSGRRIFSSLTVRENLELAARDAHRRGPWTVERVYAMFPRLRDLKSRLAGFLSGGEQQMLKIGRALVANPRLLLLDEPTEGLAPVVVGELGRWLERLKAERISILLAEQNALFALRLAERGYILEKGRIRGSGPAAALREDAEVRAYLGVAARAAAPA